MKVTCKQLAEILQVDYLQASNLLKILTIKGIAVESDTKKTKQCGRPTIIYSVPDSININLPSGKIREVN